MQLSTLIGKPVLTRAGDRLGYVTAALPMRDLKKISSLVCADDDENEFCLPARAILSVSDAVIAGGARLKAPTGIESPIGKRAYSHTGEELGALSDVELGETPSLLITGDNAQLRCDAACATIGETDPVAAHHGRQRTAPLRRRVRHDRRDSDRISVPRGSPPRRSETQTYPQEKYSRGYHVRSFFRRNAVSPTHV